MVPEVLRDIPDAQVRGIVTEGIAIFGASSAGSLDVGGRPGETGSISATGGAAVSLSRVVIDRSGGLWRSHSGDEGCRVGLCVGCSKESGDWGELIGRVLL
jgi:hypothetical protein